MATGTGPGPGDFFSELIRQSHGGRAAALDEREKWLRGLAVPAREELLFELEMLLRGIERSFNLHNLPIDREAGPVVTRDFREELEDVRDAVNQAIRCARQLLDPDADQRMIFRRYIESTLADDRARRVLLEDELDQDSPEEALFVLRQSFDSLRSVIDQLLRLEGCSFALYCDLGSLLLREIVLNRYFRPFRPLEFRLEYDRVKSVAILEALAAQPEGARRLFGIPVLGIFRLLHYLSYVSSREGPPPRRARVILALVRSESASLASFLKDEAAPASALRRHERAALRTARAMMVDAPRILQELSGSAGEAAAHLTALFQRLLGQLCAALEPALEGREFDALVSRTEMAERLRLDLWAFAQLCDAAARALRRGKAQAGGAALQTARVFVAYFQQVSYQLLRYGDVEAFDQFAGRVRAVDAAPADEAGREALAAQLSGFAHVGRSLFLRVSRRAELEHRRFDPADGRGLLESLRARIAPAAQP